MDRAAAGARRGHLLRDASGNIAWVEPPAGQCYGPRTAGTLWLSLIDRCWCVLAILSIPASLLLAALPGLWFRGYAPTSFVLVVLTFLALAIACGLVAVAGLYRCLSLFAGRRRLIDIAVGQLRVQNPTVVLLHVRERPGAGGCVPGRPGARCPNRTVVATHLDRRITDAVPASDGPNRLRLVPLSAAHSVLVAYRPHDLRLGSSAGGRRPAVRDTAILLVGTAMLVAGLASLVEIVERHGCATVCTGQPATYGDALYWLVSRLLGGDPDGLGATSAWDRFLGVGLTVYGVLVLFALIGYTLQQLLNEDRRTVVEVVAAFEATRTATTAASGHPSVERHTRRRRRALHLSGRPTPRRRGTRRQATAICSRCCSTARSCVGSATTQS